jgi:signal transduction histidine kinase
MTHWSILPIWLVDLLGALGMIAFAALCLHLALDISRRHPEHPLASYLLWLCGAIFAFSLSRSGGHIVRHLLYFAGQGQSWQRIEPISGSINSITFVVIASVTLFFHRMQSLMSRMARDRVRIEQISDELLRLNRDMEAIVSERTRAEMALRLAHEVRNPAMIISGLLKRMGKGMREGSFNQEYFDRVQEETRKLEALVKKLENAQPELRPFFSAQDLSGLAEEALAIVQSEADNKGIIILLDRSPAALLFQGNAQLVKIAVLHVLRNAIEACVRGDIIQVTTGIVPDGVEVKVADNGPGIPREVLAHFFEPFTITKGGETGLQLAHIRQIIEEHRGRVEIVSEEGRGTEVKITLPTHLGELAREG